MPFLLTCDRREVDALLAGSAAHWTTWSRFLANAVRQYRLQPQDAEDAVQRAVTNMWRRLDTVREPAALAAFALQILRREVLQIRRAAARKPTVSLDEPTFDDGRRTLLDTLAAAPRESAAASDEAAARRQVLEEIRRILEADPHRRILEWHFVDEMKPGEIAKVLSKTPNSVYLVLSRFRKAIVALIQRQAESGRMARAGSEQRSRRATRAGTRPDLGALGVPAPEAL